MFALLKISYSSIIPFSYHLTDHLYGALLVVIQIISQMMIRFHFDLGLVTKKFTDPMRVDI